MNKTKGKQAKRIRLFSVGILVHIHRACIRNSAVCICISQVCVHMYEAFVRIHPKHQNLENVEHKFRKQESNNQHT